MARPLSTVSHHLSQETLPQQLIPRWRQQASCVHSVSDLRSVAADLSRTALGCAFNSHVSDILSATLTDALLGPAHPGATSVKQVLPRSLQTEARLLAPLIEMARIRAEGSLNIVCIGGASIQTSSVREGMVMRGAPLCERMPRAYRATGTYAAT